VRHDHPLPTQRLAFCIEFADLDTDGAALAALRETAYCRHAYSTSLKSHIGQLDVHDERHPVLVARAKADGALLGTLRVSDNLQGPSSAPEAQASALGPDATYVFLDRFAAARSEDADQVVKALMKAAGFWAMVQGVDYLYAVALAPMARRYRSFGMSPVPGFEGGLVLPQYHEKPHYLMAQRIGAIPDELRRRSPRHAGFMLETAHPDILTPWPAWEQFEAMGAGRLEVERLSA